MGTAGHLGTHLPGTRAALRDGVASLGKARIIAAATGLLDPAEARAAEAGVLDRAARLTPGGLARRDRPLGDGGRPREGEEAAETAAKFARVERWAEDSGNAAWLAGELSPDQVVAADERITGRARDLKAAGLDGGMDELRARALLDLLLGPGLPSPPGPGQHPRCCARGVRQPGHPDSPARHSDPPGRQARRAIPAWARSTPG